MSKHTAGPWEVALGQRTEDNGEAYFEVNSPAASVNGVARCYFDPRLGEERAAALADAELICEAPALLAALEAICAWIDAGEISVRKMDTALGQARAAIAKARGQG